MFNRILIANRGEIACRVIRTARRLGIGTVAVYSDADREALHVRLADQAVHVGPAPASQSYLQGERILAAAKETGAEAIHPGYGFLSENAAFAKACIDAGIVFIGPGAEAIEAMGSKARAKAIMEDAGVPLIPGYHGDNQSDEVLRAEAERMGYPVLLKATAGGGGKGMRAVNSAGDFAEALASARRESTASFGDDRMLVEKLIERPRHVEIQVFCDNHGNGIYLSERDCSIQRRHQKVIEEAPAPDLDDVLRRAMGEAAVDAAQAINYRGAGTIEFLVDADHRFYFMEMNTRLQVEHPVTEMITDLDLVEWQLRIAAGETLPMAQGDVTVTGHAMEARIYAEDPRNGFLPSTGVITHLQTPVEGPRCRVDTGIVESSEITPYYDPMIAKLIVHGRDREDARRSLVRALGEFHVAGPATNIGFLQRIAGSSAFAAMDLDTGFIDRHQEQLLPDQTDLAVRDLGAVAVALRSLRQDRQRHADGDRYSPWADSDGWRVNTTPRQTFEFTAEGREHRVEVSAERGHQSLHTADGTYRLQGAVSGKQISVEIDGHRWQGHLTRVGTTHTIFWDNDSFRFVEKSTALEGSSAAAGNTAFEAPMHGTVVDLVVEPGTRVAAGDPVIVIEAMKMEQTLRAPVAGTVNGFNYSAGDLVDRGAALVDFAADTAA